MKPDLIIAVHVIFIGIMLAVATASRADDAISHLSLGHYRFTLAEPDPKAPASSILGAKYGFAGSSGVRPYIGTGIAYTLLPEVRSNDPLKLKTGVAAQAGASYQFGGNFSLSLDYKYLYIPAETQHGEPRPQSIGVGVNIKF